MGGVGCVQESGWRGVLGILPTPLVVLSIEGILNTLLFLPNSCFSSGLFKSGNWVFLVSLYV